MKDLYVENYKLLIKEIKHIYEKTSHVYDLEELLFFKCPYYPSNLQIQYSLYQNSNGIFFPEIETNSYETMGTPQKPKQFWARIKLGASHFVISKYITRL